MKFMPFKTTPVSLSCIEIPVRNPSIIGWRELLAPNKVTKLFFNIFFLLHFHVCLEVNKGMFDVNFYCSFFYC